ncbi:MAG: 4-hydroxythreonine-4-phosphate dehydrogenase PdxA [Betaproteobacteria bacterium]|nr:4-hydroxythreonine-4-phosphate dehydrogenase PdxA [Betaproteobacteria bacterium]
MSARAHIVITSGEPAGIGPDLCALLSREDFAARLTVLGDRDLIRERAAMMGVDANNLHIEHVAVARPVRAGALDAANSGYVLALLDRAIEGCRSGEYAAMVTAPVHKGIINDAKIAGLNFTGHTEYLADKTGTPQVVMMLAGGGLRVALATTHLAVKDVPAALTRESLTETLRILHADLTSKFGIAAPRVLVAGLNPHAGEGGYLGREEIDVISPVLDQLRSEGIRLEGPLPADTLFTPHHLKSADAVLAMYHDQGLPVLKYASFGEGVNITLGLPIIRTSVDHGTALDLAGSGRIDTGSMKAAIELAIELSLKQKK